MKNLANCKPSEFLKQTNKIRKAVERWLDVTDILNIRRRLPDSQFVPAMAEPEERTRIIAANAKARAEQVKANINDMLDQVLEQHPDETLEVLALCSFVDPADVDSYPMSDYLNSFYEMINNEAVLGFFSLLVRAGQTNTQPVSEG